MKTNYVLAMIVSAIVAAPAIGVASKDDKTHDHAAAQNAAVDFGVLSAKADGTIVPIGPPPCIQAPAAAIGGPTDPCSYRLHHLTPEESTIQKGGEVTFQVHGGGHGLVIYPVSKNTVRDEIGQFMCAGFDPSTIAKPEDHPCNSARVKAVPPPDTELNPAGTANAAAAHNIADGKGNVVIMVAQNLSNAFPDNRVWDPNGRLMSIGGQQFLNGGTLPAGATSNGQLITYKFMKTGRYLVICMNRAHSMNDWMFGFVNVVDAGDDDHDGHDGHDN